MMIYFEDAEVICSLSNDRIGALLRAMLAYARDGLLPDFAGDPVLAVVWQFLKRSLDADDARCNEVKRRRSQTSQSMAMQEETSQTSQNIA